jgi:hypothetical protein
MTNQPDESVLLGWYVRVTTVESEPTTSLYLVGIFSAADAEDAVKTARGLPNEKYEAVATAIAGRGPEPVPDEVRMIPDAI